MTDFTIQADPSCMDDSDPASLSMQLAREKIEDGLRPVEEIEEISIGQALQRVLREDLIAEMDVPQAANSAMDGYAFNSVDIPATGTKQLLVVGTSLAGKPYNAEVLPGTCVRIMTGGVLPAGADTVVMQENALIEGDMIQIDTRTRRGENIRPAGEDFSRGECIIRAGTCLRPAHLGLIASLGKATVRVSRKIRVAYFLTGDELCSIGETLESGKIYDSNRYTLAGMLSDPGIESIDLGIVKDSPQAIDAIMAEAEQKADVIITTGGVSVGDADYVKAVLEKRGLISFWKVAMKPGRPLAFGRTGDATFFGLPGNPVSAMVTFYQFVLPAIRRLMGNTDIELPTFRLVCQSHLKKRPGRIEYQRGVLKRSATGEMVVYKTGEQGSGILSSMAEANCFIILPLENDGVTAGETVEVQPFFGLM